MVGEGHGNGMGAALARHAMCESAFNVPATLQKDKHICDFHGIGGWVCYRAGTGVEEKSQLSLPWC